jgi:hypothetical protein
MDTVVPGCRLFIYRRSDPRHPLFFLSSEHGATLYFDNCGLVFPNYYVHLYRGMDSLALGLRIESAAQPGPVSCQASKEK